MKLLVPTDGSPGAMAALRFAARLAGCSNPAALTVLALVHRDWLSSDAAPPTVATDSRRPLLGQAA